MLYRSIERINIHCGQNYLVFGIFPSSGIIENRKDDVSKTGSVSSLRWIFPSSGILENRKHDVSETGSVSILRWGGKTPTQLCPLERADLSHWKNSVRFTQLFNHLRPETNPVSETSFFLFSVIPDDGKIHMRPEADPVSETLCCVFSRIQDDGKIPKTK
jgi:hypothetical protein